MASAQAISDSEKYDQEQKEILEKMVEEAKSFGAARLAQTSALVKMTNRTGSTLTYSDEFDWFGSIAPGSSYPQIMQDKAQVSFYHSVQGTDGSQGGICYTGNNKKVDPCGWLLAWKIPTNPTPSNPNRVYVECGPADKYDNIDWPSIKPLLEAAPSAGVFVDKPTNTRIYADTISAGGAGNVVAVYGAM